MAADARVRRIVDDLIRRSDPKATSGVTWGVGRASQFIYSSPGASVIVSTHDNDGLPPYDLAIANGTGEIIVRVTPESDEVPQEKIGMLWNLASRSARRVDETLDGLLRDLEGDV